MRIKEFMDGGTLVIRAELPGMDPEKDIRVVVADDLLTISAERMEETSQDLEDGGGYRAESHYDSFRRSVELPAGTGADAVTARYDDGVLEVRVPVASTPPLRVPITVGAAT